jgi:ureidoglycolate lyase
MSRTINVEPLTAVSFGRYGDVLEAEGNAFVTINGGLARRYYDLARIETDAATPAACSLVISEGWESGSQLSTMERHPTSSQMFFPLGGERFVVVVSDHPPSPENLRAFITNGRQGISYRRFMWHHSLIALQHTVFLVVDAGDANLETEIISIGAWNLQMDLKR